MANELVIHYPTGATLYALLFDATGQIYNGSTFGAPLSASWTDYDIAMAEVATATGIYRASMPAVAAGAYGWVVRRQAGASPAVGDIAVGAGSIRWTGTAEEAVPAAVNVTYSAGVALAGRLAEYADVSPLALEATAQAILEDTGTTLPALIGGLSGASVTVVSAVSGGTVTVHAADTWRFTVASEALEALGLADYEVLGLVVKRDARQTDNQALLYVRSDTGLARIDGAAPSSAANGALTAGVGSFSAVVHVAETAGVGPGSYTWWLKGIDTTPTPDEAVTLATGRFVVLAAGLQAVV